MSSSKLSRRDALRAAAAATAAACDPKGGLKGDSGGAGSTGPGTIEHIIFVMMENRSYDHFVGGRTLAEGKADEDGLTADMVNARADGSQVHPYPVEDPCLSDPPHSWGSSHDQFNDGACDGFVTEYADRGDAQDAGGGVMAYLTRDQVPFTNAWADAYTLCDRWFCSVMGPTWPNRLYSHAGSSMGKTNNSLPEDSAFFEDRTIWQALDEVGVDWKYYYSDLPFIAVFKDHADPERTVTIEHFFEDVRSGTLPTVCQVEPAFGYNDNHPPHHPGLGELFLASVYEAIAASGYWDKCLIIITHDEHGGFFDHVPPPTVDDDRADDGFDQLGFRVPSLLIGPWVKPGVDHTVYDHTSYLRFLCDKFGIEPWTARMRQANSLASALDTERMERNDPLPAIPLPVFDFDPDAVSPDCLYYGGPPAHLQLLAEHLQQTGLEIRVLDLEKKRTPWLRQWKAQGLIG